MILPLNIPRIPHFFLFWHTLKNSHTGDLHTALSLGLRATGVESGKVTAVALASGSSAPLVMVTVSSEKETAVEVAVTISNNNDDGSSVGLKGEPHEDKDISVHIKKCGEQH